MADPEDQARHHQWRASDPSLSAVMHDLAERVLPVYHEDDPDLYLSNVAALQMAIRDPAAARDTRLKLDERLRSKQSSLPPGRAAVYDIYVLTRVIEATEAVPFASAYERAFEEVSTIFARSEFGTCSKCDGVMPALARPFESERMSVT